MTIPNWMIDASNLPQATSLQAVALELPKNWNLQITVENGKFDVSLFNPDDALFEIDVSHGIDSALLEAVRFAKWCEVQTEKSVDKAWKHFQKVVSGYEAAKEKS